MTKHTPSPLILKDATPYLDQLDPADFVRELPDMVENLAIEFDAVRLRINHKNISMLSDVLRRGMELRGFEFPEGEIPFPDRLKTVALAGHEAVSLTLPRDLAICFADDLRRGLASFDTEGGE